MINSVRLVNFKNFADETLKLGAFTVIVGANASGKSNIRDAFRFLHGIGRGYTLAEILGGKYGPGGQMEWEPIRGAPGEVVRLGTELSNPHSTFSIDVRVDDRGDEEEFLFYSIAVKFDASGSDGFTIAREKLSNESLSRYGTYDANDEHQDNRMGLSHRQLRPNLNLWAYEYYPVFDEHMSEIATYPEDWGILSFCQDIRFLELSPARMREPSFPGATTLGDYGQNLPSVLEAICADSQRGRNLLSWLDELSPMDVKEFDFPRDPSGRIHLHIVERNGRKVSAYSASDGTLRFLGILAAFLGPNQGGLYFFEEIDNGIHPNRLWLLLDFIERQTAKGSVQVVTTTHSPALLAWMSDQTFENTSVVYRDQYWADSVIRPIADLYNLRELRKSTTLGELVTEGWLEAAMKFSEGDPDSDHLDDDEDDWEQGILE